MILAIKDWIADVVGVWDRFWFTPRPPHVLGLIRIATGAMLLYSHLVLSLDLMSFLGPEAWIDNAAARQLHDGSFGPAEAARSYLWRIESPAVLWAHHGVVMLVTFCMMIGFATRLSVPLAWLFQLMIVHRLTGALFGLDQITTMLTMYLMLAPCGAVFSVDAVLRRRLLGSHQAGSQQVGRQQAAPHRAGPHQAGQRSGEPPRWMEFWLPSAAPSVIAGVATRLAQIHLCVIYLFGGLWKARGNAWWDGSAMWLAAANREYQSTDLTWLVRYPVLLSALSHATIFWETFYCALVWPRLTRPLVLAMAVMVHAGIAIFLGMMTFGTMMIIANAIFIEPEWVQRKYAFKRPS